MIGWWWLASKGSRTDGEDQDPEETAAWYKDVFGLEEVGRSGSGGIYLSDGETNFAVLRLKSQDDPDKIQTGVNHFGFVVDDPEAVYRKLEEKGARRLGQVPTAGSYFEEKFEGPDGQIVDVSHHGWLGAKGLE